MTIVDTHVHFIDQTREDLRFDWLEPEAVHPILGNIDNMKHLVYDAAGLEAESRFAGVSKCVNVQAAIGSPDPVAETAWLQAMAGATGWPDAIVAHVDLAGDDAAAELDRHAGYANLRGIRDFGTGDYLLDARWRRGAALLAPRGLVLDLDARWETMGQARDLAAALPDLTIVLEHAGYPISRDPEYFAQWRAAMTGLAAAPNVVCKVSGLGMGDPRWSVESLRPWAEHCFEAFGTARCVFGTNWPVDRLFSSYDAVVAAYRELLAGWSDDERHAFFSGTAERVYRI